MAAIVTVSVIGRYLFSAPIPGDYDIVGILCGCAIFAFLPYCQLKRGNVLADFFTAKRAAAGQGRARRGRQRCSTSPRRSCSPGGCITARWKCGRSSEQIAAFDFYRWWTIPFDLFCMIVLILRDLLHARAGRRRARGRRRAEPHGRRGGATMSDLAIGGLGFAALFLLIALRVPIGVAMIAVGMVGYVTIAGTDRRC